jgi:parvulin-like peptidyl-prolyl isomerase
VFEAEGHAIGLLLFNTKTMKLLKFSQLVAALVLGGTLGQFALAQVKDLSAVDPQKIKEVILQDAQKQGIEKQTEVQVALKAAQETVLMRAWEQHILKTNTVTQAQRDDAYKSFLNLLGNNEYRIHHITLADAEQANMVIQRLQAGQSWDKLEVAVPGKLDVKITANKSDWVNFVSLLPEYREAIKLLKPGQVYPTAIRSNSGWHILGLMEMRPLKPPPADQIKEALENIAKKKIVQDKIKSLLPTK